jgi:hypothetical protein|tara:strand:+ start:2058 stop:2918 length:861 start_codon:yes stop_codon:yes gene_type:complete
MRYVFANFTTGLNQYDIKDFFVSCAKIPVKSILVSIIHPQQIQRALTYCRKRTNEIDIWIDSGAFTVWNTGGSISVQWYARQIAQLRPYLKEFKNAYFVSLDEIPGSKGRPVTVEHLETASLNSIKNAEYLLGQGHKVIPVHHQGEDVSVFEHYLSLTDYVGISPANDKSINSRANYVKSLLPSIKDNLTTPPACHSFGNTSKRVVENFPFYSADSASWKVGVYWGQDYKLRNYKKEAKQNRFTSVRSKFQKSSILSNCVDKTLVYEKEVTEIWNRRGVTPLEPLT